MDWFLIPLLHICEWMQKKGVQNYINVKKNNSSATQYDFLDMVSTGSFSQNVEKIPNMMYTCCLWLVFQIRRPKNITTGYKTFKHLHDRKRRPRDNKRYFNQSEVSLSHVIISILDTNYPHIKTPQKSLWALQSKNFCVLLFLCLNFFGHIK